LAIDANQAIDATRQLVIGAPLNKSMSLTIIDGKKTSISFAITSGAALPSMVGNYTVITRCGDA
jgi:hypothetical protein